MLASFRFLRYHVQAGKSDAGRRSYGKEHRYGGTSSSCLGSIGNDRPVLFGAVAGGAKTSDTKTTFGW